MTNGKCNESYQNATTDIIIKLISYINTPKLKKPIHTFNRRKAITKHITHFIISDGNYCQLYSTQLDLQVLR